MRKPVYAICKQQGADHPAHPCSLISTFVVHFLDSIIPVLAKSSYSEQSLHERELQMKPLSFRFLW